MTNVQALEVPADFESLGLDARLVEALTALGYEEPTPIQREAIPPLIEGRDIVGQAATGTGKTAAFALPILQRIASAGKGRGRPFAMVLAPTRELAVQVAEASYRYGKSMGVAVLPVYGGQAYGPQVRALERGVDIVVATPGRALDLIRRGTLRIDGLRVIVLDEADEMLDMGFADDIEAILSETPADRQTALFSATMPPRIASIARRHLKDPVRIDIASGPAAAEDVPRIRQVAYIVPRGHKLAALGRILDVENPASAIVFCRRRDEVDDLAEALAARGYHAEGLHGGMTQDQRNRVMGKFRGENVDLLIATDVAARGLDIQHLSHVVNFDVPCEAEAYVHRIGRVGRAGREGVAITLAEPREHRQLRIIEKATRQEIALEKIPSVADLKAHRMEQTRASLREAMLGDDLDRYRTVVESLAEEFDLKDVAAAAVKLVHQSVAGGDEDEAEIPEPEPIRPRPARPAPGPRDRREGGHWGDRPPRRGWARAGGGGMTRLFIGAGRDAGIRPQDLVGAITGEAGIAGRQIGSIEIADRFSLVDVASDVAEGVIGALRSSKIKGRRVVVRPADG